MIRIPASLVVPTAASMSGKVEIKPLQLLKLTLAVSYQPSDGQRVNSTLVERMAY
jgi:hypothetical protein